MLPRVARLHRAADFQAVVRQGRRAGRRSMTVYSKPDELCRDHTARAGLVVSRVVGGSVVRHRVARRLRGLLGTRVALMPAGTRLVLRAAPAAADCSSTALAHDLDAALVRLGLVPST